jgi:hypothetical protein
MSSKKPVGADNMEEGKFMSKSKAFERVCPSAPCVEGTHLFGIFDESGTLSYLGESMEIDASFVQKAKQHSNPEKRFRFSSPCAKGLCKQWENGKCGLNEKAIEQIDMINPEGYKSKPMPKCAIRKSCRWFDQNGEASCYACRYIVRSTN